MWMRRTCVTLAMVLVGMMPAVAPAAAAPVGALHFTCDVTFPAWPSAAGGGVSCWGTAHGAMADLPPIVCVPSCSFEARLAGSSETCLLSAPPAVGHYWGSIFVNGRNIGTFDWQRSGTEITFVPPGTLHGRATWAPHPPVGTCAAPLAQTVTIDGELS